MIVILQKEISKDNKYKGKIEINTVFKHGKDDVEKKIRELKKDAVLD